MFIFLDGSDSGLQPEEYCASLATLQSLSETIDADCVELRQRKAESGTTGQYLIRKRLDQSDFMEIRLINKMLIMLNYLYITNAIIQ